MKARFIITYDCNRNCPYCCNKDKYDVLETGEFSCFKEFDEVMITGGEPLLYPIDTYNIVKILKEQNSQQLLYLYTSIFDDCNDYHMRIAHLVDGIHYTLHLPVNNEDLRMLMMFQQVVIPKISGTCRLYIDPDINENIKIIPKRWARVEVKPWIKYCPVPEDYLFSYTKKLKK